MRRNTRLARHARAIRGCKRERAGNQARRRALPRKPPARILLDRNANRGCYSARNYRDCGGAIATGPTAEPCVCWSDAGEIGDAAGARDRNLCSAHGAGSILYWPSVLCGVRVRTTHSAGSSSKHSDCDSHSSDREFSSVHAVSRRNRYARWIRKRGADHICWGGEWAAGDGIPERWQLHGWKRQCDQRERISGSAELRKYADRDNDLGRYRTRARVALAWRVVDLLRLHHATPERAECEEGERG